MRAAPTSSQGLAAGEPFSPLSVLSCDPETLGLDAGVLGSLAARVGAFAVLDLETTGLASEPSAELLEVGAVLVDPGAREVRTLHTLVRPEGGVPRAIQRLTGITDGDVASAPGRAAVARPLASLLAGRVLIAHNADFERFFLGRDVAPELAEQRFLDTQDLLAVSHPDAPDLRLESFARLLLGHEEEHRALADALDTARVLSRIGLAARRGEARYDAARESLDRYAPDSPWLVLLANAKAEQPVQEAPSAVEIGESREAPVPFDEDAIAAALADRARGQRHFPGYRVREAQIDLARRFARSLATRGVLLLEGGTGVGKSLAYLAAAIPFAMARAATGLRTPVVVSTWTKLLQDQLLGKDIAAAGRMLGHPGLRAVSIKGRANYACARRLSQTLEEGLEPRIFPEDRMAYAVLLACARTRAHGEIGSLPAALRRRYPALHGLLHQSVAARAEQCSREQCSAYSATCPFARRRAALADAHLIVANHDLLLRWPPDYPSFSHAIVDEVHELSGVADEVYATEVSPEQVIDRLDEVFGRPMGLARGQVGRRLRSAGRSDALAWRRGLQQDFTALGRTLCEMASEFGELEVPERPGDEFRDAAVLADAAAGRLEDAAAAIEKLGDREEADSVGLGRTAAELRGAGAALRGALSGGRADVVAAFEDLGSPHDRWRLVVRAVSPAEPFHQGFLSKLEVFAGVSASLFVAGDAFAALGELELEERAARQLARASVASPFPYTEHMRVAALDVREGELVQETAAVLEQLSRRLGGRTLGLFTSLRRMRDVGELLAERLRGDGIEVLTPRRAFDDPGALVERFRRGGAVLLGARTFWQGLDIPGSDLEAVVIEKLPFEVPTELRRRREARLRAAGIDPFERYTLGKMLLHLKQMVGRLIRTEDDRGLVVIVEGRPERRYFKRLSDALPPGSKVELVRRDELDALLRRIGIGEVP
ncbi:MAG TPA: helicase C-terminal domain-containing protein [Myxococcota bacterium]|nr:helicase C-terminal domain-containing protein [Myxococcota bacterium]